MAVKRGVSILLAGALLSGGAAAYFTNDYIGTQVAAQKAALASQYEPITVVVPNVDLRAGQVVNTQLLASREVPREFLHGDAVHPKDLESIVGLEIASPVRGGTPLLFSHVRKQDRQSTFAALIEDGKRALTFPVDVISSISGFLKPGDRIDLLATINDGKRTSTLPLFENLNIIAAGTAISEKDTKDGPRRFQTITLMVSPEVAAKIVHAQEVSSLTATLRSPSDQRPVDTTPITVDTLLGRKPATKKKPVVRRKAAVDIIIGGQS